MARIKSLGFVFLFAIMVAGCNPQEPVPVKELPEKQYELHSKKANDPFAMLDEIIEYARKGKVADSPFNVLDGMMSQVKTEWGEPDKVDEAGNGYYATYDKKSIVFGFNKDGDIFDVRSYSKKFQTISLDLMEKTFGNPVEVREYNNEHIYIFKPEHEIELKIIIPNNTKTVDHISVFNRNRTEIENNYILDIKGRSNRLSAKSRTSMQDWRKQIVKFSKENENVYINGPDKKMVALTFDDGPDETITPAVIDILNNYNVKGNFFFLGSEVERHPDVVQKAYEKGHLVLSHSYHHVELSKLAKKEIQSEFERAEQAIEAVTGKRPAMLRPPFGDTDEMVAGVAQEMGYSLIIWSIDTLDWSQKEAANIVNNVVENVRNGDIILMHTDNDKIETKKALPLIIEALQEMNFDIVDLETLLGVKAIQ